MKHDSVHANNDLLLKIIVEQGEDLLLLDLYCVLSFPLIFQILPNLRPQTDGKLMHLHEGIDIEHVLMEVLCESVVLPDNLIHIFQRKGVDTSRHYHTEGGKHLL